MTGSVFLYRTREHSFHVDVYLLLCFRQHFQPNLVISDSPLERFAQCLAVRAGAVSPWQAGRQDLKGSSVKGVIPGGASFSGQTHWEGPGISLSRVESHTEILENQTGLESTHCRQSFSLCFTLSHALLAAAQCCVAAGAALWGLPLLWGQALRSYPGNSALVSGWRRRRALGGQTRFKCWCGAYWDLLGSASGP